MNTPETFFFPPSSRRQEIIDLFFYELPSSTKIELFFPPPSPPSNKFTPSLSFSFSGAFLFFFCLFFPSRGQERLCLLKIGTFVFLSPSPLLSCRYGGVTCDGFFPPSLFSYTWCFFFFSSLRGKAFEHVPPSFPFSFESRVNLDIASLLSCAFQVPSLSPHGFAGDRFAFFFSSSFFHLKESGTGLPSLELNSFCRESEDLSWNLFFFFLSEK